LHPENDSVLLKQPGLVDEHNLGKPGVREFVELVGALIDLFSNPRFGRIKGLSFVMPGELKNTPELERLRLVVDVIDVIDVTNLERGPNYDGAVIRGRA